MNETRELARFAAGLRYQDLPSEVVAKTKLLILDQLGAQIGISTKPFLRPVLDYVRAVGGTKECTVVNYGDRTTAENAAFVNATFGHGFEYDDGHRKSLSHPGPVVIPASLAIAERVHASGKDFILAVALGHDVMCRVGAAIGRSALDRGFHTTPVPGPLGAAASAGSILHFDQGKMLHALAIAASCGCGLTEYMISGGEVKRVHAGIAAQGGLRAALLAGFGMTGPSTALEGLNGFCRAFADHYSLEEITKSLGERFAVMEVLSKRYCSNGMLHAPIDALLKIRSEHPFEVADVGEVVIGSNHRAPTEVGAIRVPEDMTGFQYSANFILALVLVKGSNDFKDVTEENMRDPEIIAAANKVRLEVDPDVDRLYPVKVGGRVTVRLENGDVYSELVADFKGTPENPMSEKEIRAKFCGLAGLVLPAHQVEELAATVDCLEQLADVTDLCKLLVRPES